MNNFTYYILNAATHFIFILNIDQQQINNFGTLYPITSFIIGLFFYNAATKKINSQKILFFFLTLNSLLIISLITTKTNLLLPLLYATSFMTTDLVASRYYNKMSIIPILAALSPILIVANIESAIYSRAIMAVISCMQSNYKNFKPINVSNGFRFTLFTHIYLYGPLTIYSTIISVSGEILDPLNYILLSASLTITLRTFDLNIRGIISRNSLTLARYSRPLILSSYIVYFALTEQFFELIYFCITYALLELVAREIENQLS